MLKIILLGVFLSLSCVFFVDGYSKMLGPGRWIVLNIKKCPDDAQYTYKFDVTRKKINRTHDGFNAWLDLETTIDEDNFSIRLEICKYVDGGCKPYQTMVDKSFCGFINKYAKNNVEKVLSMAGADTTNCPIKAGKYEVNNFLFDYTELPGDGLYGKFGVKAYLVNEDRTDVACLDLITEFLGN